MKVSFRLLFVSVLTTTCITWLTTASVAQASGIEQLNTKDVETATSSADDRQEERRLRRKERRGTRPAPEPEPAPAPAPEPAPEPQPIPAPGVKAAPAGIYHSAGVITRNHRGGTLVREGINDQAHMSGTLVRVEWAAINSAPGVFDFSAISNELAKAAELNSAVNLAILDSFAMPDFVLSACETFDFTFRRQAKTTCLPWDTAYQTYKAQLIAALGQQFDSHPNLAGVYFSYAAMTNGIEMHWRVSEAEFTAAGYTEARLLDSYNTIMDMYNAAFPSTSIIMEVHEVFRSPTLAENAFDYCQATMGSRCGVAIWWCSSRMATNPRESEYSVYHIAQQATELSFAVCQPIGSFTDSPERFDSGQGWTTDEAFIHEMTFFINEGFRNFELWSNDVSNPALIDVLHSQVLPELN